MASSNPNSPRNLVSGVAAQLAGELQTDAKAVAGLMGGELSVGTKNVPPSQFTPFAQAAWMDQGKPGRQYWVDRVQQVTPEQWWSEYFQYIGTDSTPAARKAFLDALAGGVPPVDAMQIFRAQMLKDRGPTAATPNPLPPGQGAPPLAAPPIGAPPITAGPTPTPPPEMELPPGPGGP